MDVVDRIEFAQERLGVKAAENRIDVEQYMLATQVSTTKTSSLVI